MAHVRGRANDTIAGSHAQRQLCVAPRCAARARCEKSAFRVASTSVEPDATVLVVLRRQTSF
eukprot:7001969-Prymnesium_polylepis.1